MDPGQQIPPVIEVAGLRVGLMTCYDLRFPELALSLALNGAQLLVLPAAWVKGPQKEHHWATLLAARALDTTCYYRGGRRMRNAQYRAEPHRRSAGDHSGGGRERAAADLCRSLSG